MSDIVCDCDDELSMDQWACKATDYGFPTMLGIMRPDGTLTMAGATPTVAEFQTALAASGANKMILIESFTNGQRTEADRTEESGADTPDGLTNVVSLRMKIVGKIKQLSERTCADLLSLNCFPRVKMWVITSKGYCFGATGYRTSNFFTPLIMDGFGQAGHIPVNQVYEHNLNKTDPSSFDLGFLDLRNTDIS
jgi:hypothetical protein